MVLQIHLLELAEEKSDLLSRYDNPDKNVAFYAEKKLIHASLGSC
jgi:hypothetical protein